MATALTRAACLVGYEEVAKAAGLDPRGMLAMQNLPLASLTQPELKISFGAVSRLLEASAEMSGLADFGLRLIALRRYPHLGLLGLAAREQPTVRDAVGKFVDHLWIQTEAFALTLEEWGDTATIVVHPFGRSQAGRQISELQLGIVVHTLRNLIDETWRPEAVLLSWPRPAVSATHLRVLRVEPDFLQEVDGVVFRRRDLDRALPRANHMVARVLEHHLPVVEADRSADLVASVRSQIAFTLANGRCSTETVAARLGVDKRTLHRRLTARGQKFTRIVDEVRRELANKHLREGVRSLTEISEILGFSSLSAFSRWRRDRQELGENAVPGDRSEAVG